MYEISAIPTNDLRCGRPPAAKPMAHTKLVTVANRSNPQPRSEIIPVVREAADIAIASENLENTAVSEPEIQRQLARLLKSSIFIHSDRLNRFLRFIVEHVISGNQDHLKEYVIGSEVYDRRPPYNPSQDSIVRSEARRLRGKLKEYYDTEGKDDPVYIYLRPGSYIPVFHYNSTLAGIHGTAKANKPFLRERSSVITVGILPFRDISKTPLSSEFALGIPDELAYTLMRNAGCSVKSLISIAQFHAQGYDLAATMNKSGVLLAVEGCVKAQGNHIRITARIVDAAGFQIWTKRFDTQADSQTVFNTEEEIATAISGGLDALSGTSNHQIPNQHKQISSSR
jgi:TolB-like protein